MRYVKHTALPMDEPWPVYIRARGFEERTHETFGTEWTIRAALPRSNPSYSPDADYDPEWIVLTTKDRKLVDALEAALIEAPSVESPEGPIYRVSIVRGKDGKKNAWQVLGGFGPGESAPPATAARWSEGAAAEDVDVVRNYYRDFLGILLGPIPSPKSAPRIYKVTALLCAAQLLAARK